MDFEENQVPEAILDKLTKVCTCRSITRKTIKEAILDGAHTFPQVKEATRAGTGACGGKGCGPRIVKLLAEMKEQGKIWFAKCNIHILYIQNVRYIVYTPKCKL